MELAPEVLWLWIVAAALAMCRGAARYPSLHPVMANAFEKPFTVIVLEYIAGNAAKL